MDSFTALRFVQNDESKGVIISHSAHCLGHSERSEGIQNSEELKVESCKQIHIIDA